MTPLEIYELTVPFALFFLIAVPGMLFANWSARRLERNEDTSDR